MAWSTPLTAVANTAFTAAQFNASVRDNLLETGPAKATTAGRIFVTTGANAMAERAITDEYLSTAQTSTSTSYTDLATVGPDVVVTTGTSALVVVSAQMSNSTTAELVFMSWAVSGATTVSADDAWALAFASNPGGQAMHASSVYKATSLTSGSNTFRAKYKATGGTGTWSRRSIIVIGL